MSFQPVIPMSGFGGWSFLSRTLETQQASFARSPAIQRDTDYFRERIAGIGTAGDLVDDRRLLRVALGAFGLDADIDSRAFLKKVLGDGTLDPGSLANRLSDKRYRDFSATFGFGDNAIPHTETAGFAERMVQRYTERQFEVAVGAQDDTMRLALGLRRDLADLAGRESSDRAKWFSIMGTPPLRKVFETAYGLPASFAAIDLDQQLDVFQNRTRQAFGDSGVAQFRDAERIDDLARKFITRAEARAMPTPGFDGASAALQILRAANGGGGGFLNFPR